VDPDEAPELAEYRAGVREWLRRHRDEAPARRVGTSGPEGEAAHVAARRTWQAKLADAGLAGVTWPVRYGGRGLGPAHRLVVEQELEAAGVPGVFDIVGVGMLGPAIIAHGSDDQRSRYLPPLLRGEEVWCQLFSEPAAGSDLAAVRTRAERRPDGSWCVWGQKVWTSHAQHAAFGLMLARTDLEAPKHKGLTMFIVPMTARGVGVRPLRQISGEARFSEVFLDGVRLEPDAVLGEVGGGWAVALQTLAHERPAIGSTADSLAWRAEDFAAALAAAPGAAEDPVVRRRFGEIACELLALRATAQRAAAGARAAGAPDETSALTKITAVGAATRAGDLLTDVLGPGALALDAWGRMVSELPGLRSAGGTEEILRNLVGERVLGLPREPRNDTGTSSSRAEQPSSSRV
jgi:alkylation response protein AidB-like acyl-CoA dehydrogenase